MTGKKKKTSGPPDFKPNFDRVMNGDIPWTVEGLGGALIHAAKLHNTPHDDWDRKPRGLSIVESDGSVSRLVFNPDKMPNQVMTYIIDGLREQKASDDEIMSHGWRFMESIDFMSTHADRLREEGLVIADATDPDAALYSESLVRVLATSKYEGVRLDGSGGEPVKCFHVERVISEAKRLDAEQESEGND